MTKPLFLQIHTLVSYPGTLLNRDDVGFAKRLPFGGATRTRISSQCLKRHWRRFDGDHALASLKAGDDPVAMSVRSRHTFERYVVAPLLAEGVSADLARAATQAVMSEALGESAKAKKARAETRKEDAEGGEPAPKAKKRSAKKEGAEGASALMTGQLTILGKPELDFFLAEAREIAKAAGSMEGVEGARKARFTKEWGKNVSGLRRASGFDAALFGRMVTSDRLARSDSAVHVAHAFTVHSEYAETDYFSAVDDLSADGDENEGLGSAHINTSELTSGLFYGYVVVDVAQLVSNLEGCDTRDWTVADRSLSADTSRALVHLIARVSPGAKKGSTAPYAYAHLTMIEAGSAQPRTLANAFLEPVTHRPSLLRNTFGALATYVTDVDHVFGDPNRRAMAVVGPKESLTGLPQPTSLEAVAKFAASAILEHV